MPGLVDAPGSVAAPGSVTPLGGTASQQTAALPGTGIATGTGIGSQATAGTGTPSRTPRTMGKGTGAQTQTGWHPETEPRRTHQPNAEAGPPTTSGLGTRPSVRPASSQAAQSSPRPTPRPEALSTPPTTPGPGVQTGAWAASGSGAQSSPRTGPGGEHGSASQSDVGGPDHTTASTQSSSATRLSVQTASAKPISAELTAKIVPAAKASTSAHRPARDNGPKPGNAATRARRSPLIQYHNEMPNGVRTAFVATARGPLLRAEPLYRDVASHSGIRWELLAACDWMQCEARPSHSPVHGEKLGVVNPDGTSYRTKSSALEQCADDLIELAGAVYGIDLLARRFLSVRELANVFAAFRWGGLLKQHRTSAMEFPYSVAGLTPDRMNMRWPNIADPHAPDKPGARFRRPFGAVPVVLNLHYPVTA